MLHKVMNMVENITMNIERYELGPIVAMTSVGPLWSTTTPDGREALIQIRSAQEAGDLLERWRAWSRVTNVHIARLIDVVEHEDGRVALIQEHVRGRPLDTFLGKHSPHRPVWARSLLKEIGEGLQALHEQGIAHTDLSPANVLIHPKRGAVLVDIADQCEEGEGTPEWNYDLSKDVQGDFSALERLGKALGVSETLTALAHVNTGQIAHVDTEELRSAAETVRALRAAAAATPTRSHTKKNPRPKPQRIGTRRAVKLLGIAAITLAIALAGNFLIARTEPLYNPSEEDAIPLTGDERGGNSCPANEHIQTRLKEILSARDKALTTGDISALSTHVTDEARDSDIALVKDLKDHGLQIQNYSTTLLSIEDIRCDPSGQEPQIHLRARVRQEAYRKCHEGTCTQISALPEQEFLLLLQGHDPDVIHVGRSE